MLEIGICASTHGCLPSGALPGFLPPGAVQEAFFRKALEKKKPMGASDCDSVTSKDKCDAVADCSWCLSGAVPPACKTKDEAKRLPPAVFQCDKI